MLGTSFFKNPSVVIILCLAGTLRGATVAAAPATDPIYPLPDEADARYVHDFADGDVLLVPQAKLVVSPKRFIERRIRIPHMHCFDPGGGSAFLCASDREALTLKAEVMGPQTSADTAQSIIDHCRSLAERDQAQCTFDVIVEVATVETREPGLTITVHCRSVDFQPPAP
jgi:hypothetical protein